MSQRTQVTPLRVVAPPPVAAELPPSRRAVPHLRVLNADDLSASLPRMRARARYLARTPEDAEDLVQDTMLYVLRRPRTIAGESATGYLLQAVRNTWISKHRRQPTIRLEALEEQHESLIRGAPGPEESVADDFAWSTVMSLAAGYRDVVVAVVLCGLSYREAAEALDIPLGTVMSRLYRARRLLGPAVKNAA